MSTESENLVTRISSSVFYKEFTFDKNDFYPEDGKKELADNILWLDNLLFIIQVKERNLKDIKSQVEENKWFENKILKIAKNQIKESLNFFHKYHEIKVKNVRNHSIDISKASLKNINKVIIYIANSNLISEKYKSIKFYESKDSGNIQIFSLEDYLLVCNTLITPTELDEYLKFRERLYLKHKTQIKSLSEKYILGHFFITLDESLIKEHYLETFNKLLEDKADFDVSNIVNNFKERIRMEKQTETTEYYSILKEIALLKRYELLEFKKRYDKVINTIYSKEYSEPLRFASRRTDCGFVFIALPPEIIQNKKNVLINFTEIFKYKWKLSKCIGVLVYKTEEYFDIDWAFLNNKWEYNEELEEALKKHSESYKTPELKQVDRYKFKK